MSFNVRTDLQWNGEEVKVRGKRVTGKTAFETGLVVEGQAKALAPVKEGRLRGSITTQAADRGTNVEGKAEGSDKISAPQDPQEVFVGTAVDYAPFVEFGTVHQSAQPYLRPALDLAQGKVVTIAVKNARQEFKGFIQ